jgi:hypothetical protein
MPLQQKDRCVANRTEKKVGRLAVWPLAKINQLWTVQL